MPRQNNPESKPTKVLATYREGNAPCTRPRWSRAPGAGWWPRCGAFATGEMFSNPIARLTNSICPRCPGRRGRLQRSPQPDADYVAKETLKCLSGKRIFIMKKDTCSSSASSTVWRRTARPRRSHQERCLATPYAVMSAPIDFTEVDQKNLKLDFRIFIVEV